MKLLPGRGGAGQAALGLFAGQARLGELAAVGQLHGADPVPRGFSQGVQLRLTYAALAQVARHFQGSRRLAYFEQGPHLGEPQPHQGLAQMRRGRFGGVGVLGAKQLAPGRRRIVAAQVPFAALRVSAGKLPAQLAPPPIVHPRLRQQALHFVQVPRLQGLLSLPQRKPAESEHRREQLLVVSYRWSYRSYRTYRSYATYWDRA